MLDDFLFVILIVKFIEVLDVIATHSFRYSDHATIAPKVLGYQIITLPEEHREEGPMLQGIL